MSRYQGAQNTLMSTWSPMVSNPFNNSQYNMGLQMQTNTANQLGMNAVQNAMRNFNMAGTGDLTGGARASLLSGLSRQTSNLRQQGFMSNFQTAIGQQQFGTNVLGNMQPLQTGNTQVQKTSGLGTWLPQLIGAGLGFATGMGGGGGLGSLFGGGGSGGGGGFSPTGAMNAQQLGSGGLGSFMQNTGFNAGSLYNSMGGPSGFGGGGSSISMFPSNFNAGNFLSGSGSVNRQ